MESCSKRKGRTFSLNCISYLKRNSGSTLVYTEYRYYPTSNRKTRKKTILQVKKHRLVSGPYQFVASTLLP